MVVATEAAMVATLTVTAMVAVARATMIAVVTEELLLLGGRRR
jgi:hypothetical protein